jgi:hypothetical protein
MTIHSRRMVTMNKSDFFMLIEEFADTIYTSSSPAMSEKCGKPTPDHVLAQMVAFGALFLECAMQGGVDPAKVLVLSLEFTQDRMELLSLEKGRIAADEKVPINQCTCPDPPNKGKLN